ncbi:MAG: selenium metabolism-associated LysR family transcriptional regulator [Chloroflexi bacterium]|nr:selenium metabolism-associated LysR family transcriptional regulator [Chloroflexota bacterium]
MLSLNALKVFLLVAAERNFSAAARRLGLSQPAISAQIRNLEAHFGQKLLERSGRWVNLTVAGERLLRYSSQIMALVEETEQSMAELRGASFGTLTIGASTIPGEYVLPSLIGLFQERHPQVEIHLDVADSHEIVERLLKRRFDLAVIGAPLEPERLLLEPFVTDEIVLVCAPTHPLAARDKITTDELKEYPFILRERGSGTRQIVEQALAAKGIRGRDLKAVVELGSTGAVKTAVEAGLGLSFLSRYALEEESASGHLKVIEMENLVIKRTLYLALEQGRPHTPLVEMFRRFLLSSQVDQVVEG